uniref:SCP domain-containing protein n=1 Tax=Strongyloides venezuelensis TaxID=75913 RepID=A0A0K0G232_STRVS
MIFIYINLLFWLFLKCIAYDLAVTYTIHKFANKLFHAYRGHNYASRTRMIQDILKDHKSINKSNILLLNAGVLKKNPKALNSLGYFYERPSAIAAPRPISEVVVIEGFVKGKVSYLCLNKIFSSFQKAKIFAHLMTIKYFFTPQRQKQIKLPENMNVLRYVGTFGISNTIWKEAWGNCYYYKCFAKGNYMELKKRLLNEINLHRYDHRVPPVNSNSRLENIAATNLHSLMYRNRQINNLLSVNFVKLPFYLAPITIKRWYEEYKKYNYNTKTTIIGTEHFSSMIWKDVKYVGFAIKEVETMFYFYCVFYPKPNIPGKFKSNVLKRRLFFG